MSEGSIMPYFEYIPIFVCNPLHGSDVNFFVGGTWCWYSKYLRFLSPLHQGLEMIPNLQYPGFILFCLYRISYSLVWPQMHYLAKDDPIFLSFAPGVIGMHHPGHVYVVCWGLNSASDILGKHSTDWVTPILALHFCLASKKMSHEEQYLSPGPHPVGASTPLTQDSWEL